MPDSDSRPDPGLDFPIVRLPPAHTRPVLVTVPHFGVDPLPDTAPGGYSLPEFATLPAGFADPFAADLYGSLHRHGATVLASPYSRLFVDLNRARDDFEVDDGAVRSRRGVVRTHMVSERPIFTRALSPAAAERRLARYYDPFHRRARMLLDSIVDDHGRGIVMDCHTAIGRRIGAHQVVIGTRAGRTCHPRLVARAESVFRAHGFEVDHDVPGYKGGHIVRSLGLEAARGVDAIQIEVNATLLMCTSRREFIDRQVRGERPPGNAATIARMRAAAVALVAALAIDLESLPAACAR